MTLEPLSTRAGRVNEDSMLSDFEELIDALSSLDHFSAALEDDEVFEDGRAQLQAADRTAEQVYTAREGETRVMMAAGGGTRFGVFAERGRNIALDKLEFSMDADNPDDDQGGVGAFAYSTTAILTRSAYLPSQGLATYSGSTVAVDAGKDPKFYTGQMDLQLSFATKRVTAEVSGLQDEDGSPWTHTLRPVEKITLPRTELGRSGSFSEGSGDATINYAGFALQPLSGQDATINGYFVADGVDQAPSATFGTWTVGNAGSDREDYLAGAFGLQHTGTATETGPDTEGASVKTFVSADTEDAVQDDLFYKEGVLRFRRDPDDEDGLRYVEIAMSALESSSDGTASVKGMLRLDVAHAEVQKQLNQLQAYIALDDADPASDYAVQKGLVWQAVADLLRDHLFNTLPTDDGADQTVEDPVRENTVIADRIGRPRFDAGLRRRPINSSVPADPGFTVSGLDADGNTAEIPLEYDLEVRQRVGVLSLANDGTLTYPSSDADAVQEIQDVLDALSSAANFEAALNDGGIFEGIREELVTGWTRTVYVDGDYDDYADLTGEDGDRDRERRIAAQSKRGGVTYAVNVRLVNTDYTTFGVAWGGQGPHTGGIDPFAYSVLPQTRYPTGNPTYPARTEATYRGEMVMRGSSTGTNYRGDSEIVVKWGATVDTSTLTATFSDIRNWSTDDPFQLMYELVDESGNRYLANGIAVNSQEGVDLTGTAGAGPLTAYEYRDLSPVEVNGGDAGNETLSTLTRVEWDPRNRKAAQLGYDVEAIIFHEQISVTNGGANGAVSFGSSRDPATDALVAAGRTVDFVFADRSLGVLTSTNETAEIEGKFVGQDVDGPLAAMGIFSFTAQVGALEALPRMTGEAGSERILHDANGMATFDVTPGSSPANPYTGAVNGTFENVTSANTGQYYPGVFVNNAADPLFDPSTGIAAGEPFSGAFGTAP